jgi:hypothetical protein
MSSNIIDNVFEIAGELFSGHSHVESKPESGLPERNPLTPQVAEQRDRKLNASTYAVINALQWSLAADHEQSNALSNPQIGVQKMQFVGNQVTNQAMKHTGQAKTYVTEDQARQAVANSRQSILSDEIEVSSFPPKLDTFEKAVTYMSRDSQAIAELEQRDYAENVLAKDDSNRDAGKENTEALVVASEITDALARVAAVHDEKDLEESNKGRYGLAA